MSARTAGIVIVAGFILSGCGGSSNPVKASNSSGTGGKASSASGAAAGRAGGKSGGTGGVAAPSGSGAGGMGGTLGAMGPSGGTVSGSVNGKSFTSAMTALYAGMPDDPASTVVFLFEAAVQCSEIATPGWDKRVKNGSQVLELKMIGTTPMAYKVTTSATPAPGEASVNHSIAMAAGTPPETSASSGTVTLSELKPMMSATGSYDLTYPNGSLKGSFDATYCAAAVEP